MRTVSFMLRADVRRRWPALLSLALLLGLIGGVVLTAAAGARRTDTAYPRLLQRANATQADIVPEGTGLTGYYAALARLPHIAAMTTVGLYNATLSPGDPAQVNAMSSPDTAMPTRPCQPSSRNLASIAAVRSNGAMALPVRSRPISSISCTNGLRVNLV